jgi:hypothetical protein
MALRGQLALVGGLAWQNGIELDRVVFDRNPPMPKKSSQHRGLWDSVKEDAERPQESVNRAKRGSSQGGKRNAGKAVSSHA